MEAKRIIMNFTVPPCMEDIEVLSSQILDVLPEELLSFCEGLKIEIEEFPDETVENELDLVDAYDLLALYKSGREISPGIEKKTADEGGVLILYRRPIMDLWCESGDDLTYLLRQVMIEELGKNFNFTDDEIYEMTERHYQGMF